VYYGGVWTELVNYTLINGEWGITAYFTPLNNGVQESKEKETSLLVFPNPAKDVTQINYQLNESSNVSLKVFDLMGKEVAQVIENEKQKAGNHVAEAQIKTLSPGIYLLKLQTESNQFVIKFMKD
jgi:hypothetical protein